MYELEYLMEKAFSEGYEYAQREFAKAELEDLVEKDDLEDALTKIFAPGLRAGYKAAIAKEKEGCTNDEIVSAARKAHSAKSRKVGALVGGLAGAGLVGIGTRGHGAGVLAGAVGGALAGAGLGHLAGYESKENIQRGLRILDRINQKKEKHRDK